MSASFSRSVRPVVQAAVCSNKRALASSASNFAKKSADQPETEASLHMSVCLFSASDDLLLCRVTKLDSGA